MSMVLICRRSVTGNGIYKIKYQQGGVLGILFLIPFRKYFVEISFVFVADFGSNRIDCQSGVQQQFFGFLQTQMLQIFRISHSGPVFQ